MQYKIPLMGTFFKKNGLGNKYLHITCENAIIF